jgi:GH43 family beta-xylosidase
MRPPTNPIIPQRADPFICRHTDGYYYFTASVPEYDRIELRRSRTVAGLASATPVDVWHKPDTGPMSALIWAPEIHHIGGKWYVYFAAAPSREIRDGLFQHRIYALESAALNPLEGGWRVLGRIDTGLDTFCLDSTTFEHRGQRYFVWAQKDPAIPGNSNLYIAPMTAPGQLSARGVMLTRPELDWEVQGFLVNEGPAVLIRHGKVFIAYSASATDERYCMGLLHADESANLLDARSWTKATQPVFSTCAERGVFGPGHNSFTTSEDGKRDLLVYHARNYREIVGDPLWNPDRHTCVQALDWDSNGMPVFGLPQRETT